MFLEQRENERFFYFFFCPYCKYKGILETSIKIEPSICAFCGALSPELKIKRSISKTKCISKLVGEKSNENLNKILLEQCIVMIATGVEVLFRDIYSIFLNLEYVKEDKNLYYRFYRDTRNKFINIGQTIKLFKDDLGINLESILGQNGKDKLNSLMLKRNVIVHNIGFIDKIFLEQSGLDYKMHQPIPIDLDEIETILLIVENCIDNFHNLFEKTNKKRMNKIIEGFIKNKLREVKSNKLDLHCKEDHETK
ncbi:MAG: hypothetical protein HWN65_16425 [Candidatus Helarchaeota archaeon]|nr:hypothetical protein [Candidatus Helarchaeota archaeon]